MASSYCSCSESALFVPQGVVCQPGRCSYPGRGDEGLCRERRRSRSPPGFETFPENPLGPNSGNPLLFSFPEVDERAWKERTDVTGMTAAAAAVEAAWDARARQATDSEQAIEAALWKVVNLRVKIVRKSAVTCMTHVT